VHVERECGLVNYRSQGGGLSPQHSSLYHRRRDSIPEHEEGIETYRTFAWLHSYTCPAHIHARILHAYAVTQTNKISVVAFSALTSYICITHPCSHHSHPTQSCIFLYMSFTFLFPLLFSFLFFALCIQLLCQCFRRSPHSPACQRSPRPPSPPRAIAMLAAHHPPSKASQ
jgi:hypothetical protein